MRQNLNEIKTVLDEHSYPIQLTITDLLVKFKFKSIILKSGYRKEQGYSVAEILHLLILIPLFLMKTVDSILKSHYGNFTEMKKDSIYRLKNDENMPWRSILFRVSKRFKELVKNANDEVASEINITAFIVDDTLNAKTGRHIENVSFVHDHGSGKNHSRLGFKDLVLGYYDGKSITPLDFSIHKERELSLKKRKEQFHKEVDRKSHGFKRRKEADLDKITNAITMMKRAVKNGFIPQYALSDAWFPSFEYIEEIRNIKDGAIHVISGMRKDRRKYTYNSKDLNAKELLHTLKSEGKQKRNRKWNTRYYEVEVKYGELGTVKLYFCRFPHQKDWRLFISTEISLSFTKMMEIYSIRWTIEVMFKELKQYLNLGKCQSRDFDAHVAQITISCILFILLSYLKRKRDYETIGGILSIINEEVTERTLAERIWSLFEDLLQTVIKMISDNGCMDISKFKESEEYQFLKELFEASLLGNQLKNVS